MWKAEVQERPRLHHSLGNSFNDDLCFPGQGYVAGDRMRDNPPPTQKVPEGLYHKVSQGIRAEIIAQISLKLQEELQG